MEFENVVFWEFFKVLVFGGIIYFLMRYVMNYVNLIFDYKLIFIELIVLKFFSSGSRYFGDFLLFEFDFSELEEERIFLVLYLIWVIVILEFNLEGKL